MTEPNGAEPIAIVGLACRVPGAADARQFWRNLADGVESLTPLTREQLIAAGVDPAELADSTAPAVSFLLDDIEYFDADLFGLSAREAEVADPQHRVFLELCHTALEDAGYDPARYPGEIGVYGGRGTEVYRWEHVHRNRSLLALTGHMGVNNGNLSDNVTTLVSYRLGLRGPSVGVYTACSTSLVAVHMATEALRAYECDMALAGGVSIELPVGVGSLHREGDVVSADGHVRPFDARATGTIWGSGGGIVLLKRLADAVADGDHIRALIIGNAINNDGAAKVGFTAPSVDGQAAVLANALAVAGVPATSVSYVEAHGTATALGDPIEVAALLNAYGRDGDERGWCALGSVKANIGHLSQGAGVAGLIKTVLALEHERIPPSLNYATPNPAIDFASSPFYVNAALSTWERTTTPRRAGVSSFGIGGTNAHVVVEEAPAVAPAAAGDRSRLLLLSARTPAARAAAVARLADHLGDPLSTVDLADVAFTLRSGRGVHAHRAAVPARDRADAAVALRDRRRLLTGVAGEPPRVAFLFSGQGAQYAGMGAQLYTAQPEFARAVDECAEILAMPDALGEDIRPLLFATGEAAAAANERLAQTALTQPALFTIDYALARLWQAWGIRPAALIGHSLGEYVAATVAGVFDLPDALRLVATRGRLMQAMPPGAMLAMPRDESEIAPLLPAGLTIATVNGPGTCVVAGPVEDIEAFAATLSTMDIAAKKLVTSHAFHSAMMDPVLDEFTAAVAAVTRRAPALPCYSNRTGEPLTAEQATDPAYWAAQLRQPVRFGACLAHLLGTGPCLPQAPGQSAGAAPPGLCQPLTPGQSVGEAPPGPLVLVECGPGKQLAGLARIQVPRDGVRPLPSLPGPADRTGDLETLYAAVGQLWTLGAPVEVERIDPPARRVPLPAYPYQRTYHWVAPDPVVEAAPVAAVEALPLDEWCAVPVWRQLPPVLRPEPVDRAVVLVAGPTGDAIADRLRATGTEVVEVRAGEVYGRTAPDRFTVRPDRPADFTALVRDLPEGGPLTVVHAWTLAGAPAAGDIEATWLAQDDGLFSLLHLVQGLAAADAADGTTVCVVTAGTQHVLGDDLVRPEHATVVGVVRSAPLEVAGLRVRHIDAATTVDLDAVLTELAGPASHAPAGGHAAARRDLVALRGGKRWGLAHERIAVPAQPEPTTGVRDNGVYLITGGLGGVGRAVALDLARRVRARLVLLGRSGLPPRGQWDSHPDPMDSVGRGIAAVREMEAAGAEVLVVAADVADPIALRGVRERLLARFGRLDGIVHAAGAAGGGLIEQRHRADLVPVLAPKVAGPLALRAAFADLAPDFVVLFSSVTGTTGGAGEAGYCAANAFLDAYPASSHGWPSTVVSVAWDGWQGTGMLAGTPVNQAGMSAADGVELLHRVLGTPAGPHVLVTPYPLSDLATRAGAAVTAPTTPKPGEPPVGLDYVAPRSELEETLAKIWCAVLGVASVGVDDNFFELDGNSLVAVQLIAHVRKAVGVRLPMRSLFDSPTVAGMAEQVARLRAEAELARQPRPIG